MFLAFFNDFLGILLTVERILLTIVEISLGDIIEGVSLQNKIEINLEYRSMIKLILVSVYVLTTFLWRHFTLEITLGIKKLALKVLSTPLIPEIIYNLF